MTANIGSYLTKRAFLNPNVEALYDVASGDRFTYAQLNALTNRTANALTDLGVVKGDKVGLLLMNGKEFEQTFFAVAKLGAVVVPLNWRLVAEELGFILTDSDTTTLVFGTEFISTVEELHSAGSTPIRHWVHVGDPSARPDFAVQYEEIQDSAPDTEPGVEISPDDLLYIMYTSGTTGLPKGVMHTHHTAMWGILTVDATADQHFGDRYLVALPLFHVGALTPAVAAVYAGITQVVMREFDPVKVWKLIEEEKITTGLLVPAMLQFMLQFREAAGEVDFSTVRWFMSGASPVPKSLIEAYAEIGIEIHQVYGLTETCGPACLVSPDDAIARAGSTGKEFFFTEVRVVRPDGTDCAPDEPGEVLVKGEHIMIGYLNRPEATAEAIVDGWLHTGDLAVMDADGYVYIQDRIKDMIISGGENVYPAEIENVILQHEGVADCAVIGVPSTKWGESPCAVVVRADPDLDEAAVLSHCDGRLARFKLPRAAVFVEEIPRNPSGKALKRILREQFADISLD